MNYAWLHIIIASWSNLEKHPKQKDKKWETSLTTAVLQPKTRRYGNNVSCLICPHNKRFGAEQRTQHRHGTILTIVKNTRLACAMLKHPTRPERDQTNLQKHTRQQEHELTTTVKIRYAVRATWYCTDKWHTNETQIHKKNPRRDGNARKACSTTNIRSKMLCLRPKPRSGQLAITSAQT